MVIPDVDAFRAAVDSFSIDTGAFCINVGALSFDIGAFNINAGALSFDIGAFCINVGALSFDIGALSIDIGALSINAGAFNIDAGALSQTRISNNFGRRQSDEICFEQIIVFSIKFNIFTHKNKKKITLRDTIINLSTVALFNLFNKNTV